MYELSNFDAIQISIASPEKIRSWSKGEVTKPETINYRTLKPEPDGLFCERIFGPTRDWECHCGRYKKIRHRGVVCDKCGVEVTKSKVRRERMGHIELASPVTHIWYLKGVPSKIATLLNIPPKDLEQVAYFVSYIVRDPGNVEELVKNQVISDKQCREITERYAEEGKEPTWKLGQGAEVIKELLKEVDLDKESEELRKAISELSNKKTSEQKPSAQKSSMQKSEDSDGQKKSKYVKRLEIVEAFRKSGNKPEWMVLDVLPVLPPELRPMVQLDGGRFASSDLNELYRRVINRNNRLKRLKEMHSAEIMLNNEKRMLQEAVDALIDNGRRGKAFQGAGNRDLKSLSGYLAGKQGRFRQNLLGKRVDYSGRSVIVVGPELKLYQCGLPKEMALELFKPFIIKELLEKGISQNPKSAKRCVEQGRTEVWDILDDIIKDHPVLLNRAPTLHRLGIQAFEPVLVEGRAIKLHPLACTAFNADFDGDQMAVHVPLSIEAQAEARILMLCTNNILKLSDGKPVVSPTQDMVIGSYYLTIIKPGAAGEGHYFSSFDEAMMAYMNKELTLQSLCYIRTKVKNADGKETTKLLHTTIGRYIFNETIPQDLRFVDRTKEENAGELEVEGILGLRCNLDEKQFGELVDAFKNGSANAEKVKSIVKKDVSEEKIAEIANIVKENSNLDITDASKVGEISIFRKAVQDVLGQKAPAVGKSQLSKIIDNCFKYHGATETAEMLDKVKALGYKYSTIGSITASVFDMVVPETKEQIIKDAQAEVAKTARAYARGLVSEEERYNAVVKSWNNATDKIEKAIGVELYDFFNPIWMMANSGARGSMKQIRQLVGMRGLMADPSGKTIEMPVMASFRDGLSVLDYFVSSHGGRKGLADTALKTADSGYLTRRLVDVSHSVIVREQDCGDDTGTFITPIIDEKAVNTKKAVIESLADRISGRFSVNDVADPYTGEIIIEKDTLISQEQAQKADEVLKKKWEEEGSNIHKLYGISIRSVLTCKTQNGVCVKCYGKNMASGNPVKIGEAVGVIAAQSIGEPGTQLTMRTFHSGGVATDDDITQGLPRVEELFEARKPKGEAVISLMSGVVKVADDRRSISVTNANETEVYAIPFGANIIVKDGEVINAGDALTRGSINPQHMFVARGIRGVQEYIAREVQSAYRQSSVEINDKHIEVMVRQMLRKVKVEEQGDSNLLPGTLVDLFTYEKESERVMAAGGQTPKVRRILLGITKTALATESFLSAASFQETSKVLADAAINSKVDELIGLKENVIIGKLIPAGTGMKCYRNIATVPAEDRRSYVEEAVAQTAAIMPETEN